MEPLGGIEVVRGMLLKETVDLGLCHFPAMRWAILLFQVLLPVVYGPMPKAAGPLIMD